MPDDDSVFGQAADWLLANPVRSGAILVVGLTAIAIVANAVFFQEGRHPSPLFTTRPEAVPAKPVAVTNSVPLPQKRDDAVEPEMVRSEPVTIARGDPIGDALSTDLVMAVQQSLAARGMYDGKVDGKLGAKTRTSIAAYETKYGLPETGMPSESLVAHLQRTAALRAQPAPAVDARDKQLMNVQSALNSIGYGPIQVTGRMDSATADSIRRFELENGMPITGEASANFIRKLAAIGAINPE
jgi:peptidoglycan hydrolase-like protein with peptidoglycan-binding domain